MRVLFFLVGILAQAFIGVVARAGADSSGGGELLGDRINPWFLENTTDVSYCLDIDAQSFPQEREQLAGLVRHAIEFWQQQLTLAQRQLYSIRLGTQKFHERIQCDVDTDIHFQFGRLQKIQQPFLTDPQRFVGVAVRTSYDTRSLKGQGFVYISADRGPTRYESADLEPNIWDKNNGLYLRYLLIHEMGHIFGVPHTGATGMIMEAAFPESLVKKSETRLRERLETTQPAVLIFDYRYPRIKCAYNQWDLREGLNYLDVHADCIKLVAHENENFEIFEGPSSVGPWQLVGSFAKKMASMEENLGASFVSLYLTPENRVYPIPARTTRRDTIIGSKRFGVSGMYQLQRNLEKRPLNVNFSPTSIQMDGLLRGFIQSNIFWMYF